MSTTRVLLNLVAGSSVGLMVVGEVIRMGQVYKTKFLGYAKKDRVQGRDEIYASISTKLTRHPSVTLEPVLE